MKRRFTILTAALALLAFLAFPMGMNGQTTVASYSRNGNSNTIVGGEFSTTFSAKSGYYQDASGDCYMQILNTDAYWTSVPTTISFAATIGGGTGNHDLTNPVYVSLLDENGDVIDDTETAVTSSITTNTGDSYTISIPIVNNVYGVKLSHEKESGYNVRYYSFSLSFVGDGDTPTPTTYTVTYHANVTGIEDIEATYDEGATVTIADNTFSNPGYTFTEWNTEADGNGDSFAPGDEIEDIDDDLELYAIWTENAQPAGDLIIDFESAVSAYTDWTFTNMTSQQTGSITAHGGTNYGTTGGKATASIVTNSKIATPYTLTCYVSKQSTNTAASTWTIQVSSDGSSWTDVESRSASDMNKGEWKEFAADLTDYTNVYVRVYYSGSTAVRNIDDLTLITAIPSVVAPTFDPADGATFGNEGLSVAIACETPNTVIYYTVDGSTPDNNSTLYENAIILTTTATIKAIAYDGSNYSNVATATYTYIDPNAPGTENNPYTVAQARDAIDAGTGTQGVYATGIVSAIPTAWNSQYSNITFNFVDNVGDNNFLQAYRCGSGTDVDASTVAVGDVVVVYGNLTFHAASSTYEFGSGCQLVSLTHPAVTTPTVTVTPSTINAPFAGADGTLTLTYENIEDFISFDYYFCDPNGGELQEDPDWIYAEIQEEDENYTLYYLIDANQGEARTAYLKVYTFDDNFEEVYAIVTVNQEEYVAPTYAELPFSFNGVRADIENTDGLYQDGLGSDYNASTNPTTQLKFDGTGDWLVLQFNESPGTLTFDIKGNSFSGGTFTVQTSENGTTYVDLAEYTELGDVDTKTFDNLGENVRYIKWIYITKNQGNVGLGNITLAEYEEPVLVPSITVANATLEVEAEGEEGTLTVTYENITDVVAEVYFCDANGEAANYDWIDAEIDGENNVFYAVYPNEGEARIAYFKVYALDDNAEDVYSNLVTISQAAAPQQYTLTVEPFENLELITFVNDEVEMESEGTVQVIEGAQVMLSIVADQGYVMETLMVNGVNHVSDIAGDFTYTFTMPGENVTINATAVEYVAPVGGDYVRITSLDQLTDGSIVVIAARYDETVTNGYYAMQNATSGKPTGEEFTSTISGNDEILPASIVDNEDDYYWTVNVTENGYTFTNAEGFLIGYSSSTNFATGGNNTEWTIERITSEETAMSGEYTGFVIKNKNTNTRAFAFNGSAFGAYATSNMANATYNFFLDFFAQSEAPITETYTLSIDGYTDVAEGTNNKGYYLIASPVTVDPATVEGMTDGDFDLYYFDQAESDEWRNYEAQAFDLVPGKGYLYAKKATDENPNYNFTLTGIPYSGIGEIELEKADDVEFSGWNLIGNPFGSEATLDRPFYRMADGGAALTAQIGANSLVFAMEGVFVEAENHGDKATFTALTPGIAVGDGIDMKNVAYLNLNISKNLGGFVDNAIVRFDNGAMLGKFQLNQNSTKLYITENGKDYAIVRSANEGEMPVNFKAEQDGSYTLSVNAEEVSFAYLHLIDNMTGVETDLLANPSYSFEARTTDYANRFKLVFATGSSTDSDTFAFFSNGSFVINNEDNATLQVIDVNGRVLTSENINGCANVNLNAAAGVYMIRLVNGDNVKVQKVVVR